MQKRFGLGAAVIGVLISTATPAKAQYATLTPTGSAVSVDMGALDDIAPRHNKFDPSTHETVQPVPSVLAENLGSDNDAYTPSTYNAHKPVISRPVPMGDESRDDSLGASDRAMPAETLPAVSNPVPLSQSEPAPQPPAAPAEAKRVLKPSDNYDFVDDTMAVSAPPSAAVTAPGMAPSPVLNKDMLSSPVDAYKGSAPAVPATVSAPDAPKGLSAAAQITPPAPTPNPVAQPVVSYPDYMTKPNAISAPPSTTAAIPATAMAPTPALNQDMLSSPVDAHQVTAPAVPATVSTPDAPKAITAKNAPPAPAPKPAVPPSKIKPESAVMQDAAPMTPPAVMSAPTVSETAMQGTVSNPPPEPEPKPEQQTATASSATNVAKAPVIPVEKTETPITQAEPVTPAVDTTTADAALSSAAPPAPAAAVPAAVPSTSDLSIAFGGNAIDLTPEAQLKLKNMIQILSASADSRIQVRAYATGDEGSKSSARRISLARALAVRSFLMDNGIKPTRVDVRALGTETDRSPLDRVDLVFER